MSRKIVFATVLILLLIGMSSSAFNIQPVKAEPKTIVVPDDYSTIQEAVDAASWGDTILVRVGTYYENVSVWKPVLLLGENVESTIVNGSIEVVANNVDIVNFTITSTTYLAEVIRIFADNCRVERNIIIAPSIQWSGIHVVGDQNEIIYNIIHGPHPGCGIIIGAEWLAQKAGRLGDTSYNNIIAYNYITCACFGIMLTTSALYNQLMRNIVYDNDCGVGLVKWWDWEPAPSANIIVDNIIRDNNMGIETFETSSNIIYHNNFIDNTRQVYDESWDDPFVDPSLNIWDNGYPSGGNYWDDYAGVDADGDGIGDAPYVIDSNNIDHYPLMNPWGTGIPIASFKWCPSSPEVGELVTFDASASLPVGGEIVSYEWDFGDGNYASGEIVTHRYSSVGSFTVTLNITDSEGLWDIEQKQIQVLPVNATIDINPNTLNLRSEGEWITAYIELPEGYNVSEIDASTIMLDGTVAVDLSGPIAVGDYDNDTVPDLMVCFNWTEVCNYILSRGIVYGNVTLTVSGKLYDGTIFSGTDTILVSSLLGDINVDGIVNMEDLYIAAISFGSNPNSPEWNPKADINRDNIINLLDLYLIAANLGKQA